jgi:IclR family acetate operon transcriptional repressor
MVERSGETGAAKTLVKALRLLEAIAASPAGLTLAELSRLSDLPKPTALRVLRPLVEARLLRGDDSGVYRLGPGCLVLGTTYLESLDLREEARPVLRALVAECNETCHLGVLDGTRIVYIEKAESQHSVRMHSRVGRTNPVHSTGLGKAILGFAGEGLVDAVIAAGLERRTPRTITDPAELRAELKRIRRLGYAVDDVENEEGIRCVGAPVRDHSGEVIAGISIAGPDNRVTRARVPDLADLVRSAADELSARLGCVTERERLADRSEAGASGPGP